MDINNIQALIAQGLLTDVASVDPNKAYVAVGVFQPGNRQSGPAGNAYPSYAMPISEFLAATKEDVSNKSISVVADQTSNIKYPSVKAVYDWVTSLFVKKGTLTNNTILKGSGTDTATDSSITDDGTTVTVNSPTVITSDNSNNQIISIDNLKALVAHDVKILFNSPIYSFANMQANETVETDASKNLVSVAKGTAYNKAFGTTAGTVLEGDKGVLKAGDSMSGALNEAKSTDIVSATTTDLSTSTGNLIHITGTTTITSFGTLQAGSKRTLVFDGALTLTYNATSLILPGAANITTSAGDTAIFISEGSGNWRCVSYITASDTYINFAPSFTGFSVAPTVNTGDCRYKMLSRNTCHFIVYPSNLGTSNATTFTITLPFASANVGGIGGQTYIVQVYNNGGSATGVMRTRLNSNIADVYMANFGTFTASSGKSLMCSIVYQTEL